jgi:hypothetical protein
LTKANERSYEIPFCQLLTSEGHQIVHLSRHGSLEQGKDILSLGPNGEAFAFQLKGGNITNAVWERELAQITRLVEIPIKHPSIPEEMLRRVFLVTNGRLDEEVRLEIVDRNRDWARRGYPTLETIVGGQLLQRFLSASTNVWPAELRSAKLLLELYLADGRANLNKSKLQEFILSIISFHKEKITNAESKRLLASAAIFTTYALSVFVETENHVALFEGWTLYIASLVALVDKYDLEAVIWHGSLELALESISLSFEALIEELKNRQHFSEGNVLVDAPLYRGRMTWLLGLLCAYELWKTLDEDNYVLDEWVKSFILEHRSQVFLWGEGAIPYFLSISWFLKRIVSTPEPDFLLKELISTICQINNNNTENSRGLPSPYRELEEVVAEINGLSEDVSPEDYRGRSYTLESLISLFVRRNWRQEMRKLWPMITYVEFAKFEPDEPWQFCLWRCEDYGRLVVKQPKLTQSWTELREE